MSLAAFPTPPESRRQAWWLPLTGALVGVLVLLALGWGLRALVQEREQRYRHMVEGNLGAINQLQVKSIARWRQRRSEEANLLTNDSLWGAVFARWRRHPTPADEQALRERLRAQLEQLQYSGAYLVDPEGRLLLDAQGARQGWMPALERPVLARALREGQPAVSGLQRSTLFTFPYFSLVAPLFDGDRPAGAVWLVLDARSSLYPLLEAWPADNRTAESLLVERDSAELVFLSPLRHASAPLQERQGFPKVSDATLAAAASGTRGTLYGRDYRGVPVLATASAVPDSSWLLISKIDESEAFQDLLRRERFASAFFASVALLVVGGGVVFWRWRVWRRERLLRERLEQNMRWLETAQRAARIGYFAYDLERRAFFMSSMANAIFGRAGLEEMSLRQWIGMLHEADREAMLQEHGRVMAERSVLHVQYRIHPQGDLPMRWVEVRGEFGEGGARGPARMTGTVQDITERRATEEQLEAYRSALEAQVRIDPLTGLANRLALNECIGQEWERAVRSGDALALLMIDVDRFKAFNDHYGHLAGDRCLQAVTQALAGATGRAGDVVARYGGEEFAVLLPGADAAQALAVAERLRTAVQALAIEHAHGCAAGVVTISVGVCSLVPAAEQPAQEPVQAGEATEAAQVLLRQADAALYRAKQSGRDQSVLYGLDCQDSLHDPPDSLMWADEL